MGESVLYRNRQRTRLTVAVPLYYGWMVVVGAILWVSGNDFSESVRILTVLLFPVVVVTLFFFGYRSLLVSVTSTYVELSYFFGWPRKRIDRADIVSVDVFRIPWWYGLGIRATPKGWMWSIWGRDTVLLTRANGKGFLIGTDDPDGLGVVLSGP